MMEEDDLNIPPIDKDATIQTVALHISYMWREIRRLTKALERYRGEQKDEFQDIKKSCVNRTEYEYSQSKIEGEGGYRQRLEKVEDKTQESPLVKNIVFSIIGAVTLGFLYVLINFFIPQISHTTQK